MQMITSLCYYFDTGYRYIKPPKRPEPPVIPQTEMLDSNTAVSKAADDRDLVWKLSRNQTEKQQHIPAWSAFNAFTSSTAPPVASVVYMPFIRESPLICRPSILLWYALFS